MDNQIRDQLHTIQTEDLTAAQILSASGGVYLSKDSQHSQDEIVDIVSTVKSVKAPFYGAPLPGTFDIAVVPGVSINDEVKTPLDPTTNQTYQLLGATLQNLNPAGTCTGDLILSNGSEYVILAKSGTIAASTDTPFDLSDKASPIFFTKEIYLAGVPTAGTPIQMHFKVVFCKVVQ